MCEKQRKIPKLRFPNYNCEWEKYRLDDLLIERSLLCTQSEKNPLVSFTVEQGVTPKTERYDREALVVGNKKSKKYKLTLMDDIVYNPANLKFGAISRNKYGRAVFSPIYVTLEVKSDSVTSRFLEYILTRKRFIDKALRYQQGTVYERQSVNVESFLLQTINIPSINEQNLISNLLDKYDKNITLHQRKLDNLKLKKKALLQKLFPKNGERYPELRFPGFTDAWEQRKLDDIAKIKTGGGTPKTSNPEYWSGNIPWIQSSDLVEGDIVHVNINKFINSNALKNSAAKLIARDSIALVTRVGVGKVAVINQDFTTSQDFLSLSDFDGNDIKFLAYQLYRLMQENAKVLQGTSIKGITKTELIEQSISIPSLGQEQNLIANVLSKIDSIITLHQRKLDHLKLQKKALLQQMFV